MGQSLERVRGHRTGGTGIWFLSYCHRQFSEVFVSVATIRGGKLFCVRKFISFALPLSSKGGPGRICQGTKDFII